MSSPQQIVTKTRPTCFCNHCKTNGFTRRELNGELLCPTCAAIPGVRGYRDPNKRGLEGGSNSGLAYWERTKDQLNVITDDGAGATPAPPLPMPKRNEFLVWRDDVLAAPILLTEQKLYLLMLATFADYQTGANCFPRYKEQGAALGISARQIRRLRNRVIATGWIVVHRRTTSWRRTSDLYQFLNPRTGWRSPDTLRYGRLTRGKSSE